MKLNFQIPGNSTGYVGLSNATSRLNRRFMRQGLNWAVANVKVTSLPALDNVVGTQCYVSSIPHTWVTANAWMKSFSMWKKQQDEAVDAAGAESIVARFRDFKIVMDGTQGLNETGLLTPVGIGPGDFVGPAGSGPLEVYSSAKASEEWLSSQIVIPNHDVDQVTGIALPAEEVYLQMLGGVAGLTPGDDRVGMIMGYAQSRSRPQSPEPIGPAANLGWMSEMFDVGADSSVVLDNAEFRNNELPYDADEYPGTGFNMQIPEVQGYSHNQSTTGINTFNTGPFTAPCGLIRFDFKNQNTEGTLPQYNYITVTLVPGTHRGYLAETMEEF